MSWKMFWTLFGAVLSVGMAVVPMRFGVAWWEAIGIVVLVAAGTMLATGPVTRHATMFAELKHRQRGEIAAFTKLGVGAYALWSMLYIIRPESWIGWILFLPAVSVVIYWGTRGVEYKILHEKTPVPKSAQPELPGPSGDPTAIGNFRDVLDIGDYSRVSILGHEEVMDDIGDLNADQFLIQIPPTSG